MRQQHDDGNGAISLASASAPSNGTVALPTVPRLRISTALPRLRVRVGPVGGRLAVGGLIVATFIVVIAAASGPSVLVPRSRAFFPGWEAGPLHLLVPRLIKNPQAVGLAFSGVLLAMIVFYAAAVAAVRVLSLRLIVGAIVALHVILLMSPPLQLNDVFNYLGYARLGGLHALNPYTHVIKQEFFDPVYGFTTWHSLRSPYGSLFTALTYPLAFTSLAFAYWSLKLSAVVLSLGFLALLWQLARQLGRDPRYVLVFVALNPIYLIYAVGGFHNDFMMLVPAMAAISLVLAGRDRLAGGALVLAIAVKFTAVLLLPVLLVAVVSRQRRLALIAGAAVAAVPMIALSLALFGLSIPNLSDQSSLLTDFSIPNIVGLVLGVGGGTPVLLKLAIVGVVGVVAYESFRQRNWLVGAGWSTFALLASLSWLVPWYVIWLLPLAALGSSVRLRKTALAMTVFLILAFMPATALYMAAHGINPLGSSVGQASQSHQHKLAN